MTNLAGLTLAAPIPVAGLASDVTLDSIAAGSDITTNNVSTVKHGLCPKLPADATKYLDGSGAYTVPAGGGGSSELDYVQITSTVTVSGSEASPTTVITGNAVTYDGATRVEIAFYTPVLSNAGPVTAVAVNLFEGSTNLGRLALSEAATYDLPCYAVRFLTPSAGAHTYSIKAWRTTTDGAVFAGAGGSGNYMPAFMRITRA